ncbi:LPS export ABC transporter permease LptG [Tropicimonas sp. S265A]|uniref:LPS export ABC transporter permease LptG n=1 Tax=Tropicimonas sp. S265A TaxID=3415134 RepID=UPI003C7A3035
MTLQLYFARRFLVSFLLIFLAFFGIIMFADMVENLRSIRVEGFGVRQSAYLAFLQAPEKVYDIIPLIILFTTVALFLKMARTSELVVTRAAGRSAIRSLIAPVLSAALIGGVLVSVLNPIVATTSRLASDQRDDVRGRSVLSVSQNGLWLRQSTGDGQMVIHATATSQDGTTLFNTTFISFDGTGTPLERIAAAQATLVPGAWDLTRVKLWDLSTGENPEENAQNIGWRRVPTTLTLEQILDSIGDPSAVPIWELPAFIARLEQAGFAARSHRVWFQTELAAPVFLVSMVLIGAAFTMRHTRFGRTGLMVLFAVMVGFAMFFLKSFTQVLGDTGKIPILAAAWFPPIAGICLSLALLLHQEDG